MRFAVALGLILVSASTTRATCPPGTTDIGDGKCITVITQQMVWSQAQAACQALGVEWDFVSIHSTTESVGIANAMIAAGVGTVWVGINDMLDSAKVMAHALMALLADPNQP